MSKDYKELESKIFESLAKDYPEYAKDVTAELDQNLELCKMVHGLTAEGLTTFDLVYRQDEGESWLQVEYFSRIDRCVIYDYDVDDVYDNLQHFAESMAITQQNIDEFEAEIILKSEHDTLKDAVKNLLFIIKENKSSAQTGKNDFEEVIKTKFIETELETLKNLIK